MIRNKWLFGFAGAVIDAGYFWRLDLRRACQPVVTEEDRFVSRISNSCPFGNSRIRQLFPALWRYKSCLVEGGASAQQIRIQANRFGFVLPSQQTLNHKSSNAWGLPPSSMLTDPSGSEINRLNPA